MDRKASPFTLGPEHHSYSSSTVIFHTEPYYTVVDILSYYPGVKARKISTLEWVTVNTYHRQFVKGLCCPLYVRLTVLKPDPGVCGIWSQQASHWCPQFLLPPWVWALAGCPERWLFVRLLPVYSDFKKRKGVNPKGLAGSSWLHIVRVNGPWKTSRFTHVALPIYPLLTSLRRTRRPKRHMTPKNEVY